MLQLLILETKKRVFQQQYFKCQHQAETNEL